MFLSTVAFVPGATLALALVNVVLAKSRQMDQTKLEMQDLCVECKVLTKSVNEVK